MFVRVTGGISLAEGSFCALGGDVCCRRPVRTIGGWRRVAIALLPASAIESLFCVAVSKTPPIDVIELEVDPRRLCPYRALEPGF